MKALTVRQPWAWAIMHAQKDFENRTWKLPEKYVGETIAIHAAKGLTKREWMDSSIYIHSFTGIEIPEFDSPELVRSAIVGTARLVACVKFSFSLWFEGPFGWQLADVKKLDVPIPCKGSLSFWTVPEEIVQQGLAI